MKKPYAEVEGPRRSKVQLFLGDCIEGMGELRPRSVDVVVTSPPYNIGVRYSKYRDSLPREEYLAWVGKVGESVRRVLKDNGSFFLNIGSIPTDPWTPLDVAQQLRNTFILQNMIHWVKSIAIPKRDVGKYPNIIDDVAVGHYKPIGGNRFLNEAHEFIFHLTKNGKVPLDRLGIGVPYQDKSNVGRWKKATGDRRCRGNTWFIPYQTIRDSETQRPHPTTFPDRLPEMCIRLHGLSRTRMVLDPFIGLGSTALASLRLGVSCVGFDIDPRYLAEARNRLEEYARKRSAYTAPNENESIPKNLQGKADRKSLVSLDRIA